MLFNFSVEYRAELIALNTLASLLISLNCIFMVQAIAQRTVYWPFWLSPVLKGLLVTAATLAWMAVAGYLTNSGNFVVIEEVGFKIAVAVLGLIVTYHRDTLLHGRQIDA